MPVVFFAELLFDWFMGHLGRTICTVHSLFAQTGQEGMKCAKAKLRYFLYLTEKDAYKTKLILELWLKRL